MTSIPARSEPSKLGVARLSLTGAIVFGIFYLLCWLGSFLPVGPVTHRYLELFADPPITGASVLIGVFWSIIFGAFMGALAAIVYNALAAIDR